VSHLIPEPDSFEAGIPVDWLERCKLPVVYQIAAELIEAGMKHYAVCFTNWGNISRAVEGIGCFTYL
jgi:hypothetical protein